MTDQLSRHTSGYRARILFFLTAFSLPAYPAPGERTSGTLAAPTENVRAAVPPDASFKDQNGKNIRLSALKGKVVFLNFWATWCPPCIREMPSINQLYLRFKDHGEVVFLTIGLDRDFSRSLNFVKRQRYEIPVYAPSSPLPPELLGRSIPTTVILDRDGNIVLRHEGMIDFGHPEFLRLFESLLEKNGG